MKNTIVDVILLSYCKTRREFEMTEECLRTLHASDSDVQFRVVVVESSTPDVFSNVSGGAGFRSKCLVEFPQREFNYNEFLQIGFSHFSESTSPYVFIINNDLVFQPGFVKPLLLALNEYDSVSPWCPGYHEEYFGGELPYYEGYGTSFEVCGWSLMIKRSCFDIASFQDFFPTDFQFWFQDNYYATMLQKNGLRHALVRDAEVIHLFGQSHDLIPDQKRSEFMEGAENVFALKLQEDNLVAKEKAVLSILVTAQTAELSSLQQLLDVLQEQSLEQPVEIIAVVDNGHSSSARKLQHLVEIATGGHVVVLNATDTVTVDFIAQLVGALADTSDVDSITYFVHDPSDSQEEQFRSGEVTASSFEERKVGYCIRASLGVELQSDGIAMEQWRSRADSEVCLDRILVARGISKVVSNLASEPPLLSIGMLTVPSRLRSTFPVLVEKLANQALGLPVELIAVFDNKSLTVGTKRNAVLALAQGDYIAFVDDDDDVAQDYVACLVNAIEKAEHPDCIVYDAYVTFDGADRTICRFGIEYEDVDTLDEYFRSPNHLCAIRRDIAASEEFPNANYFEDRSWSARVRSQLRTQARVPRVLYHYHFSESGSETFPGVAPSPQHTLRKEAALVAFAHIALIPGWREIFLEQLEKLISSGLYAQLDELLVGVVGENLDEFDIHDPKIRVIAHTPNMEIGEIPTLTALHQFCTNFDGRVLYIHTKGVSRQTDAVRDWRHLMEYFLIEHHADCLARLTHVDICGVNWRESPLRHFSGNFWWANSHYVRRLDPPSEFANQCSELNIPSVVIPVWWACEFWIASSEEARISILHDSQINHYELEYPRSNYCPVDNVLSIRMSNPQ